MQTNNIENDKVNKNINIPIPHTLSAWVHYGPGEVKEEITFENVSKYNHLKPIIRKAFGIEALSPYIQLYSSNNNNNNINNKNNSNINNINNKIDSNKSFNNLKYLEPEDLIDVSNLNNIYVYVKENVSNVEGEVRVFSNDNDEKPTLVFESGIDWIAIEKSFHIVSGWLKRKGDQSNKRIKAPFASGDYTLVGSIPIFKTINIVYKGMFGFSETNRQVNIKFSDNSETIKKKIRNSFNLNYKSRIYLNDQDGTPSEINYDLNSDKKYTLLLNWSDSFF